MTRRKKLLILIACQCVILFTLVTGTVAWLTHETQSITNTFTPSDINITLTETDATDGDDTDSLVDAWSKPMIPGATIEKDPVVTVTKNSEDCYVFVKIEEDLGAWEVTGKKFTDYLEYSVADVWTALSSETGVYYRFVSTSDADQPFSVLSGNKVTVKTTVTKADMEKLYAANAELPTLKFTASAIQSENLLYADDATPEQKAQTAWGQLNASGS